MSIYRLAAFITAPSMITLAVTYFQNATSSFRASATIVFLRRPPLRLGPQQIDFSLSGLPGIKFLMAQQDPASGHECAGFTQSSRMIGS